MSYQEDFEYQIKQLPEGALVEAIEYALSKCGSNWLIAQVTIDKKLTDGTSYAKNNSELSSLDKVCDFSEKIRIKLEQSPIFSISLCQIISSYSFIQINADDSGSITAFINALVSKLELVPYRRDQQANETDNKQEDPKTTFESTSEIPEFKTESSESRSLKESITEHLILFFLIAFLIGGCTGAVLALHFTGQLSKLLGM